MFIPESESEGNALCYFDEKGKKQDAELHDEMLCDEMGNPLEMSEDDKEMMREVCRGIGLDEETISAIYG